MSDGLPDGTRPGRVALAVADLDRAVRFYRDVVGLEVRSRGTDRARLGSADESLLELRTRPDAPGRTPDEAGLFHVAFRVPSRAALGDAVRRIRDRWRLDGASDHAVSEALYLSDPEGNGVEVYRDRPRDAWPVADDGRVEMTVDPLDVGELGDLADGGSGVPPATTVGHVHLEVSSLAGSESFYVDTLGLRVRQRFDGAATFLAADDYHHHLGLNVWENRTEPSTGRGLDWFELRVPEADAIDAVTAALRDDDDGPAGTMLDDGVELTDPDGIRLRLNPE